MYSHSSSTELIKLLSYFSDRRKIGNFCLFYGYFNGDWIKEIAILVLLPSNFDRTTRSYARSRYKAQIMWVWNEIEESFWFMGRIHTWMTNFYSIRFCNIGVAIQKNVFEKWPRDQEYHRINKTLHFVGYLGTIKSRSWDAGNITIKKPKKMEL